MNIKRTLVIILSFIIIFSLTACQGNNEADNTQDSSTNNTVEEAADIVSDKTPSSTTASAPASETSVSTENKDNLSPADMTVNTSDNPADWSTEQIIDVYKNAAKKSDSSAISSKNVEIKNISVNNGEYKGLFEFITPIMSKLIANNSDDEDGITGGYNNLAASDVASAKAYKSGNNVVIEMVMREQTSGACDGELDGTVGHAITTVGDISVVIKQLNDLGLPLDIPEKNTKIYYTNPVVKVLINENGEIVNGTWRYTVEIRLDDYKAFGKPVDTTSVVMDNTITVNGGF